MNAIQALVAQTRENCKNYDLQVAQYLEIFTGLINEFKVETTRYDTTPWTKYLTFQIFSPRYGGHKICFSYSSDEIKLPTYAIKELILSGNMERFLEHVTEKVIPEFVHDQTGLKNFEF